MIFYCYTLEKWISHDVVATLLRTSNRGTDSGLSRDLCLKLAQQHYEEAKSNAEAGQISQSAQMILKALDQERRAGSVGPQVVQLIKPRSSWGNRS